jgi:predicted O-methyltransferase YrrM
MQGLEWGSGRSTIWFAGRLGRLTSVEHSGEWHRFVNSQLRERGIRNVDYRRIELDHPVDMPTTPRYDVVPKYVAIADEFADGSLDFVLIDGHYRQACVPAAMKKLKPGGFLTIDNSNWMPQSEWGVPTSWPLIHKSTGFDSETSIWQKP